MAPTSLRSSRRSGGLAATRSSTRNNAVVRPGSLRRSNQNNNNHDDDHTPQLANIGRKKRPRDSTDKEDHPMTVKRSKIAIEILPRPKSPPKTRSIIEKAKSNARSGVAPRGSDGPPPPKQNPLAATQAATQTAQADPVLPPQKPTIHRQKVANGIKHEIDRLQPSIADLKDERRKLRSQEATRFKSELSAYFPEYDEIIGNEPKEDHILNYETPILIVDSAKTKPLPPKDGPYPIKDFPDSLFDDITNSHRVDFSFLDPYCEDGAADPLSDEYFAVIHRKPERQERTLRNTDRGRAQHEKDQVTRLLGGLQGYDWLKLMGVSGITESRKKDYEEARAYFIKGCEAILDKFRMWREEEKRRKLEKEQAMAEAEAEEAEELVDIEPEEHRDNDSDGDPPDYSDVDAAAARQLHAEATARSRSHVAPRKPVRRRKPSPSPEVEKEFTSFFRKPYLRAAALGKHRRSGRTVEAWGHPIPEIPQRDFDLPEEYRDEETLRARARKKRRERRVKS